MRYYRVLRPINILVFLFCFNAFGFAQQNNELKLAENLLRARNFESALILFQKHYKKGNSSNRVINGISTSLRELGRNDQLIKFLKDVNKKLPEIFSYSIELGKAYFLNDQIDSALSVWQQVYTVEPPQLMRYRLVAQAMASFRLFDDAIEVYQKTLKEIPKQDAIHLDMATLYKAQLNYEKAAEHYLYYYQKFKKQHNYIRSLLINMAKDDEAADRIIITILDFNDDNDPDLNELLANLYMRKKDYQKAFEIITEIENNTAGSNLVYLNRFANEAAKDKSYEYVIRAYEFALKKVDQKLTTTTQFRLAQAYYKSALSLKNNNNIEESDIRINKALGILTDLQNGNSREKQSAAELSADIYKEQFNDLDLALEHYKKINLRKTASNNADQIRIKIADVYLLKNNLTEAEKYYRQVKGKKFLPIAQFNLAELQYFNSQFSKAKESYNVLVARVGMKDSLANNALDRIFQIEQFLQDSVNFSKYSQASLLKRQKKYSEAAKKFSELYFAANITSFQAGIESVALYNKLGKDDETNQILQDMIKYYPEEDKIDYAYFLLANNYKKEQSLQDALTMYQEILIRFPTSFYIEQARLSAREINILLQEKVNN